MASFDELWNQGAAPRRSTFDDLWDQNTEPVGPKAPPDPFQMMVGRGVQGAADILGGFNSFMKDRGVNTEAFFQPAREAARTQKALGAAGKVGAGASGVLDTFDSLINAPVGAIQQAQGVAPAKRWRSDMASIVESIPQVAQAKEILPEAFGSYKTAAGFLAPLPGGGGAKAIGTVIPVAKYWAKAAKEGSKKAQIWDMAATGGLIGGAMTAGARVKANQEIDPLEALGGAALGTALGGGAGWVGHKAGDTFEALWNKIPQRKPPAVATDVNGQILPSDPNVPAGMMDANHLENTGLINREALDADDLLALDQLQGKVLSPQQGLSATEAPPLVAQATASPTEPVRLANQEVPKIQPDPNVPVPEMNPQDAFDMKTWNKAYEPVVLGEIKYANNKVRDKAQVTESDGYRAQDLTDSQLESELNQLELSKRFQGVGKATKAKIENVQNILNAEILRRKDRLNKGWEQNWARDPDMAMPPPEVAPDVLQPPSEVIQGTSRGILDVDANGNQIVGRDRVAQAPDMSVYSDNVLPPEIRSLKTGYAAAKAAESYHATQLEQLKEAVLKRFAPDADEVTIGGLTLKRHEGAKELNRDGEALKNDLRAAYDAELPARPEPETGGGVRAMLDDASVKQIRPVDLPAALTEDDAANMLRQLQATVKEAEKAREGLRKQFYDADGKDNLLKAQDRLRQELNDPYASLQSTIPVQGPDGQIYNVMVEAQNARQEMPLLWRQFEKARKNGATEHEFFGDYAREQGLDIPEATLADKARAAHENLQAVIKEMIATPGLSKQRSGGIKMTKSAQALMAMTGFGLMSMDQGANAAGVRDERGNPIIGAGTVTGLALVMAGAGARFGPQALKQFAKWSGARAASIYKDTLDHVDYLDKLLVAQTGPFNNKNLAGNPTTMMKPLGRSIWEHNAGSIMANWGIDWTKNIKGAKWDGQTTKARSLSMLRSGAITTKDALSGKAGTVFEEMTAEQRKAAVGYFLNQKTLAYKVNRFEQDLRSIGLMDNPDRNTKDALAAFDYLKQAVAPKGKAFDEGLVDAYHKGLSNAMDFYFFMNPKHHLLNLTDSFIGGGSRVGATRIAKAWKWLATDPEIKAIFKDANIVGSYRAEQIDMAAKSAKGKNLFEHDFSSDQINAERVALGSVIQFAEDNAARLKQTGYTGDSKQFVKDLFGGKLDPTHSMDAGVQMAETLSRTLGVDPYRVNTDFISRQKFANSLGVFIKQPARISRLAFNYVKKGEYGKLFTMVGMMAMFGGSAAMPVELKSIWEQTDPNSYFKTAGMLDSINPYTALTGMNASRKLEWGVTPLSFATVNPAVDTAKQVYGDAVAMKDAVAELAQTKAGLFEGMTDPRTAQEREKVAKKTQKLLADLMQIVLNRVPIINAPTGEGSRLVKQLTPAVTGETNISYYHGDDRYAPSENVKLSKLGMNPLHPALNAVLPGELGPVYRRQNSVYEQKVRQDRHQRVPREELGYNDPLQQLTARR